MAVLQVRSTFSNAVKFRAAPISGFFLMHSTAVGDDFYPANMKCASTNASPQPRPRARNGARC